MEKKSMIAYTDGSCLTKSGEGYGPGGWGFIAILENYEIHIGGCNEYTTNNKMELFAVIELLRHFPLETDITIYSDSNYVINCAKNLWKRKKNIDLWKEYDVLLNNRKIMWKKVKGHSGDKYNDKVDKIAKKEANDIKNKKNLG